MLIASFNQADFLSDVMQVDGWESALQQGCCTVLSSYFIKLALANADIQQIGEAFDSNKAAIAQLQQEAVNRHAAGMDGYGYVNGTIGLTWFGTEYTEPMNNLNRGNCCLCLLRFTDGRAHTIAVLYHQARNTIYMFDPNTGVYQCNPQAWYLSEYHNFIQRYPVGSFVFRNVVIDGTRASG